MEKDIAQVLDEAIARIHAGESVEECLTHYPEHRLALEPILRTSSELWICADAPLPAELDEWVDATGLPEFSAFAQQIFPSQESPSNLTQYTSSASDVLDDVLALVQTGVSVDECFARYPEHRLALEQLVDTSGELQAYANTPLPAELDEWLDTTGLPEFVMLAEQMTTPSRASQGRRKYTVLTQRAVTTALVGVLMVGVVDAASANSLPSDPLYQWKLAREDINLALADSQTRRQLHIDYAQRRVTEIEALHSQGVEEDSEVVTRTFDNLKIHANAALNLVNEDTSRGEEEEGEEIDEIVVQAHDIVERAQNIAGELASTRPQPDEQEEWSQIQEDFEDLERQLPTARPDRVADVATSTPSPSRTPTQRPSVTPGTGNDVVATTPTSRVVPPVDEPPSDEEVVPTRAPRTRTPVEPTPGNNPPAPPTASVPGTAVPTYPSVTLPPTATPVPVGVTQVPRPPTPDPTRIRPTDEVSPTVTILPVDPTAIPTAVPPLPTEVPTEVPPEPTAVPPLPTEVPTEVPPEPTAVPTEEPPPPPTATPLPPDPTATEVPPEPTAVPTEEPPPPPTATPLPPDPTEESEEPTEDPIEDPPSNTDPGSGQSGSDSENTPALTQSNASVQPILDCVVDNENGTFTAYFGFSNSSGEAVNIAVGPNNYVSPGPNDQGQPSTFESGRSSSYPDAVFSVNFSGDSVTWHLNGDSVTASSSSSQCYSADVEAFDATEEETGASGVDEIQDQDPIIDDEEPSTDVSDRSEPL